MKKFEEPKLIVEMLDVENVMTTSGGGECTTECAGHTCDFDMGGF